MLNIKITTIPHTEQRYPTVGDYKEVNGRIYITISELGDTYKESLVAIHELVEFLLCRIRGIDEKSITEFDMQYEFNRHPEDTVSEPGDSPKAPYRKEHRFAENIERLICQEMGIDWHEYEKTVYSL